MSIKSKFLPVGLFIIVIASGGLSGCGNSNSGPKDGGLPDGALPPDGGNPDGGNPDGGNPDGGNPDGSLADAGANDSGGTQPGEALVWVQVTDDHQSRGSCDNKGHLAAWQAALTYIHDVIKPSFVVNTGDLADDECPAGQHQADWDDYHTGVINAGFTSANYYDMVGNHDAHGDPTYAGYLANSISGADGQTMHTWTRQVGSYTYSFIGTLTAIAGQVGGSFLQPAYDWTKTQLVAANNNTNVFVFAHHADFELFHCTYKKLDVDTGLLGSGGLLDTYHVTAYVAGHVHIDCENAEWNSYAITTYNEFFGEENIPPDHSGRMRIFVLTGSIWANRPKFIVGHGSQVIISYPQDKRLAVPRSPSGHEVTGKTTIVAKAFSSTTASLQMTVDSGTAIPMTTADNLTYQAQFDFGTVAAGTHTIAVQDLNNSDATNGQDTITVVSH
ncbi:MAG: metallophosphoesterase [Myxococcota bacterium]|jgi:hypothetical protein